MSKNELASNSTRFCFDYLLACDLISESAVNDPWKPPPWRQVSRGIFWSIFLESLFEEEPTLENVPGTVTGFQLSVGDWNLTAKASCEQNLDRELLFKQPVNKSTHKLNLRTVIYGMPNRKIVEVKFDFRVSCRPNQPIWTFA